MKETVMTGVVIALLLLGGPGADACGPNLPYAAFSFPNYPDYPLKAFAGGNLGIVQSGYARSYLYVAYRYMSGHKFSNTEQKDLLRLWADRLNDEWTDRADDCKEKGRCTPGQGHNGIDYAKQWLETRKMVPGAKPVAILRVYETVPKEGYYSYILFTDDALKTAAVTLKRRIEQFGKDSKEVRGWLEAQDKVFENRYGKTVLPDPPKINFDPIIQKDRLYQTAAAFFYSGNYDRAYELFQNIAGDKDSPWSQMALYLAARCLVRKATLLAGPDKTDLETLKKAEEVVRKVLSNADSAGFHQAAHRLLQYIRVRLYPKEQVGVLSRILTGDVLKRDVYQALWDYTFLLDVYGPGQSQDGGKGTAKNQRHWEPFAGDDLTEWILAFQSRNADALKYSLEKYRATGAVQWLIAALSMITPRDPAYHAIHEASLKISRSSPAYPTVMFHIIRLLGESGKFTEAKKQLDRVLPGIESFAPRPALNKFYSLKMYLATDVDEFIRYVPRIPAGIIYGEYSMQIPIKPGSDEYKEIAGYSAGESLLAEDSAHAFNTVLPLKMFIEVTKKNSLPESLRHSVALAGFTRAIILDDMKSAGALAQHTNYIERTLIDRYLTAQDKDARQFAAAYLILKYPGLRPYVDPGLPRQVRPDEIGQLSGYGRWWCAYETENVSETGERFTKRPKKNMGPLFLTETDREMNELEQKKLSRVEAAPNYLAGQVISFARKRPDDPRVPEALHLAVKATRYGCRDDKTGSYSKEAFRILHGKYPKSDWAVRTKYWY